MLRTAFTKLVLGISVLFLAYTLIMLMIGISMVMDPESVVNTHYDTQGNVTFTQDDFTPRLFMYVCFPVNMAITVSWFYFWYSRKKRDAAIENLPTHLSMLRVTRLEPVAGKMGISMKEMERIMKVCMKEGTVRGNYNAEGEFVFEGTKMHAIPQGYVCPNCGGKVEKVFLEGEIAKCYYCDAPLDSAVR